LASPVVIFFEPFSENGSRLRTTVLLAFGPMGFADNLAKNIKHFRMHKQMSQPDLAERADLSRGYIYMLESGDMKNPSVEKLYQIAKALDCTIADLLGHPKAAPKFDVPIEIPESLREFAKRKKREGDPLEDDELLSLARTQYRGKRPQTIEDWEWIYEFLRRTLESRKK
jgi:transcriptional regulator with XRE-family HTH domain